MIGMIQLTKELGMQKRNGLVMFWLLEKKK